MKIRKKWTKFKNIISKKQLTIQFIEKNKKYKLWASENGIVYYTKIYKTSPRNNKQIDFEDNYKVNANGSIIPKSLDNKSIVRAESRPIGFTTAFTGQGDSDTEIGKGKILSWDFSNSDDLIDMPSGSGLKRKRIECKFIDDIYIKEGTIYFHNAPKGCYLDFYVVCPSGQYYKDNNGNVHQATEDTIISHYVNHHPLQGSVPMGDELNTESCSDGIPNNYKLWLEITTLDSDEISNGNAELEIYRKRTVIL